MTKEDLIADQRCVPPFGSRCTTPIEEIAVVVEFERYHRDGKRNALHQPR